MITLQQAIDLATEAHKGQWRFAYQKGINNINEYKNKNPSFRVEPTFLINIYNIYEPYITHPLAVMEMMSTEKEKIVAVLHNAIKDTKAELFTEYGKCYFLFNETQYRISIFEHEALQSLTKFKNESYTNYIKQISQNKLATKVKLADIFHNLLDNPSEHTKQKYLKAIPILLQSI